MRRQSVFSERAPQPGGAYSQAIKAGGLVFLSGQLPLDPQTCELVSGTASDMYRQCFRNLSAVCEAAGGSLGQVVKLNVYFVDQALSDALDEVLPEFFERPYPARTRLTVARLSKGAAIEVDGIMVL
jgi:reactive intermediate/imine deaminase